MTEKLVEIVSEISGNIPFIMTVRDDGYFDSLDGKNILPLAKHPKRNDTGTRVLGFLIANGGPIFHPFLMLQNIERKRMANPIRLYFYGRILETAKKCLEKWGECYILDLHATEKQPTFGQYDIIFGTDHRRTSGGNFDIKLAGLLQETGALKVFVPSETPRPGEIFPASLNSTLIKWLKFEEPKVVAVQMEIHKSWFKSRGRIAAMALEIYTAILSLAI